MVRSNYFLDYKDLFPAIFKSFNIEQLFSDKLKMEPSYKSLLNLLFNSAYFKCSLESSFLIFNYFTNSY